MWLFGWELFSNHIQFSVMEMVPWLKRPQLRMHGHGLFTFSHTSIASYSTKRFLRMGMTWFNEIVQSCLHISAIRELNQRCMATQYSHKLVLKVMHHQYLLQISETFFCPEQRKNSKDLLHTYILTFQSQSS